MTKHVALFRPAVRAQLDRVMVWLGALANRWPGGKDRAARSIERALTAAFEDGRAFERAQWPAPDIPAEAREAWLAGSFATLDAIERARSLAEAKDIVLHLQLAARPVHKRMMR